MTAIKWSGARLQVLWFNPTGTLLVDHPTFSPSKPNGQYVHATPDTASKATNVHVDYFTDSTTNSIQVPCS